MREEVERLEHHAHIGPVPGEVAAFGGQRLAIDVDRPESMGSSRLIVRQRVDLPLPEGPTTTRTSPRSMLRLTSRRTCRSPKLLLTFSRVRSVRAHPDPDCWAAVLLFVMARVARAAK